MWLGFCSVETVPSPKVQDQAVMASPVDWSVNRTARGAPPEVGVALKPAAGGAVVGTVVGFSFPGGGFLDERLKSFAVTTVAPISPINNKAVIDIAIALVTFTVGTS